MESQTPPPEETLTRDTSMEEEDDEARSVRLFNKFLTILCGPLLSSHFARMLGPREITSIAAIHPNLLGYMSPPVLSKLMNGFSSGCFGLGLQFLDYGIPPTVSEAARVSAWYLHARETPLWANLSLPTAGIEGRRFFCDDAYFRFPLDVQPGSPQQRVNSFCFLRPSSPRPFANALVIATDDSILTVYALTRHWYKRVLSLRLPSPLITLVSSPKGSCMLGQSSSLTLVLLVVKKYEIVAITSNLQVHTKKIRSDAFLNETTVVVSEPLRSDTHNEMFQLGNLYTLAIDRQNLTVAKNLFWANSGHLGVLTVSNAYKADPALPSSCQTLEYIMTKGECDVFEHHCCAIKLIKNPRGPSGQRFFFACSFRESMVCNWIYTPDRLHAHLFVLTARSQEISMQQEIKMFPEDGIPRCRSRFRRPLTNLVIYRLDFANLDFSQPFLLKPVFYRSLPHLVHLARDSQPSAFNAKHASEASDELLLTGGDRLIAARFPYSAIHFVTTLWSSVNVHLSYNGYATLKPRDPVLFDATVDFMYLSIFKPGQQVKNLKVGKMCDCSNRWSIEEASMPCLDENAVVSGSVIPLVAPQVLTTTRSVFAELSTTALTNRCSSRGRKVARAPSSTFPSRALA
jgi:hypothetical protein